MAAALGAREAALRFLSGRPPVELLGGVVRLGLTENTGAFLGLGRSLPEGVRAGLFVAAVGAFLAIAAAVLVRTQALGRARTLAASAMIGGGLANLLDRLPDGRVTDYVVVAVGPIRTGVFNLPDAVILAGALFWVAASFTRRERRDAPSSGA